MNNILFPPSPHIINCWGLSCDPPWPNLRRITPITCLMRHAPCRPPSDDDQKNCPMHPVFGSHHHQPGSLSTYLQEVRRERVHRLQPFHAYIPVHTISPSHIYLLSPVLPRVYLDGISSSGLNRSLEFVHDSWGLYYHDNTDGQLSVSPGIHTDVVRRDLRRFRLVVTLPPSFFWTTENC